MAHEDGGNKKFAIILTVFQVVFIVLFGIFGRYHQDARPQIIPDISTAYPGQSTTMPPYAPASAIRDYYPSKIQNIFLVLCVFLLPVFVYSVPGCPCDDVYWFWLLDDVPAQVCTILTDHRSRSRFNRHGFCQNASP